MTKNVFFLVSENWSWAHRASSGHGFIMMTGIQLNKNFSNFIYPILTTQNEKNCTFFIPILKSCILYGHIIHEETCTNEMNVSEQES